MRARELGQTGRALSVIGQGTWNMELGPRRAAIEALRAGIDVGLTHIDTAEMYGSGKVEEIVGQGIRGRRDEVFLVSKVLPSNASRQGTIRACEASLGRLGTDVLDLYLLHWPGSHPLEDTIGAFEELQDQGKIRAYGVSNFDVDELEEAVGIAGPGKIACNQVLYHLGTRAIEHRVCPWCAGHRISVVAYSPFGSGRFPGAQAAGGMALADIAQKHGATPRQVALAFLLRQAFVIPKAARKDHVLENRKAAELILDAGDLACLNTAFPRGHQPSRLPMI